jgi:hypothetical protein
MRGIGWILIAGALALIVWAWSMTTSVHTDINYLPGIGLQEPKDVVNLGLMQQQMMLLQAGLAMFVAGTVTACIGDLKNAMRDAGTAKYVGFFEPEAQASPSDVSNESATS